MKTLILVCVGATALATSGSAASTEPSLTKEKIAFSSGRDNPTATPQINGSEIYLMKPDGTDPRRLTVNDAGDGFPALSPDLSGRMVFDSNRRRAVGEAINTSDLFLMNVNGTGQTFVTRGGSPTWVDSQSIAFHASASGTGTPIKADPGAATSDSDIFVLNLASGARVNITHDPTTIDDDPDASSDGQRIAFTSHPVTDNALNSSLAEIYSIAADGTGSWMRLTQNLEEERGPAWSADDSQIAFACRRGGSDFEICVMDADGRNQRQLTDNGVADLTPSWAPSGQEIVFHRLVAGSGLQLFFMHADGTHQLQLTQPPGMNLIASWGQVEAVPPTIACDGADDGWHASDVSLTCTASDDGSGLASAGDAGFSLATAVPVGTETADAVTASRQVCDMADNCAAAGPIGGNKVDKKAPTISIDVPADGASFLLGDVVTAEYGCSDGGAGVAACAGDAVETSSVGTYTFTVEATDAVGNVAAPSHEYTVGYDICVLYDQTKAYKRGSTIPIRIQLCDAVGSNVSSPAIVVHATALKRVSDDASGTLGDAGAANADADFRYDATIGGDGGYIFNLSSRDLSTGTWALAFAATGDPTSHTVQFQVR